MWEWDNSGKPTCEKCIEMQRLAGDIRDCDLCPKPTLLLRNITAYDLYKIVGNQYIVAGLGSVIGLNHASVWMTIDNYAAAGRINADDKIEIFEKILFLSSLDIEKMNKKIESSNPTKK